MSDPGLPDSHRRWRVLLAVVSLVPIVAHGESPSAPTATSGATASASPVATAPGGNTTQTPSQREAAALLDRMTRHLAGLASFSVAFRDGYDVVQASGQKIEFGETRRLTIARPGHLRVEEIASDGKRDLAVFDGKTISVYDADAGVYAQAPQPGSVDDALVYFVRSLRMRMPLALLLTKNLPGVLAGRVKSVDYVERTDILGVPTHHIAGRGENVDFQFWIKDGDEPLPLRVVITYIRSPGQPQFWANFSEWNVRPAVGASTFQFVPPREAKKIPFAVQVNGAPPAAPPAGAPAEGRP
jgi:hypothetical protein